MATMTPDSARRVLLRSSWQMANIGDMAHAPGAIGLLTESDPALQVVLWARRISAQERTILQSWFPGLEVITGDLDADGRASTDELAAELDRSDFLIHGSGRLLAGEPDVVRWADRTGKPYGFLGITVDPLSPDAATNLADMAALVDALGGQDMPERRRQLLAEARFVYCRDSISLAHLSHHGLQGEQVRFGPDAVFAFRHEDVAGAEATLAALGLTDDGFVTVVPRLRYTPYHQMLDTRTGHPERIKDAINTVYRKREFAVLIDVIVHVVREHGRQVLLAPEMSYAPRVSAEIAAALPGDVAASVKVLDQFWGPATATSTYARSAAVVSMECHSPILAARVGTPSLYLRQPSDTIKGRMWADVGLGERLHELETPDPAAVVAQVSDFLMDQSTHRAVTQERARSAENLLQHHTATALSALA